MGERVVELAGGRNFRDMGGYETADGRTVRWGRLYRSGTIGLLTDDDWDHLRGRGIKAICDLRSTREREAEPFRWQDELNGKYFARDYESSFAELRELMKTGFGKEAEAREAMMIGYRRLAYDQAPAYRQLFQYLVAGDAPLIVNCSAGKDRAGTASALILSALGVPRETVVEDFVLTDTVGQLREKLGKVSRSKGGLSEQPPGVVAAILGADPNYIRAALDGLDQAHGGVEGYLADELGIGADALGAMREAYLE